MERNMAEQHILLLGLIGLQVIVAVYGVLVYYLLSIGLPSFVLISYGSVAAAVLLSPFAVLLERSKWPRKFGPRLVFQLGLIALCGVTGFQELMLLGAKNTSPAVASAMPNLAPGIIFVIACFLGYEKVEIGSIYASINIFGTIVCLGGAIMMSCTQRALSSHMTFPHGVVEAFQPNNLLGCAYLLLAVALLSCAIILQAATLQALPAPITLSALAALLGAIFTAIAELIQKGQLDFRPKVLPSGILILYAIFAGALNGFFSAFQAWAVKRRGPVFVSLFSPVGTVCAALVSAVTMGESITLGGLVGMGIMFSGLYMVLWAKNKEEHPPPDEPDVETRLLS